MSDLRSTNIATLAGGCFWCVEAVYQELKGVKSVNSGYSGGHMDNPNYDKIHYEDTGHAESVQIEFDPEVISYREILEVFYYTHDPTTLNRQGNDVGEEYRSIIFYHDDEQKKVAEEVTRDFAPQYWDNPIVTEIVPFEKFWPAEDFHQNFFKNNSEQAYCRLIINPKLQKFRAKFESLLK